MSFCFLIELQLRLKLLHGVFVLLTLQMVLELPFFLECFLARFTFKFFNDDLLFARGFLLHFAILLGQLLTILAQTFCFVLPLGFLGFFLLAALSFFQCKIGSLELFVSLVALLHPPKQFTQFVQVLGAFLTSCLVIVFFN